MTAKLQLEGQVFGRLTVVRDGGRDAKSNVLWECKCSCGATTRQHGYDLRGGKVVSCGCYAKDSHYITHGKRNSKTYNLWAAMKQRCLNPNDANWISYGGRGITLCEKWRLFEGFLEDMGEKPEGLSLDRKDNNSGYSKANCRWATLAQQAANKRTNVWVNLDGVRTLFTKALCDLGKTPSHAYYHMQTKCMNHQEAVNWLQAKRK